MRRLGVVLVLVAAVVFLAGLYSSMFDTVVFSRGASFYWKGAIALLGFAIAVLQLHAAPKS